MESDSCHCVLLLLLLLLHIYPCVALLLPCFVFTVIITSFVVILVQLLPDSVSWKRAACRCGAGAAAAAAAAVKQFPCCKWSYFIVTLVMLPALVSIVAANGTS